jgi:hypothetical protein
MGVTAKGLPYPESSDPVYQGADAIKALAQKLDAMVPAAMAAGANTVTYGAAASSASVVVTFPAGRFTQPPLVAMAIYSVTALVVASIAEGTPITTTSMTVIAVHRDSGQTLGTATAVRFWWQAVQMLPGASPG